MKEKRKDHTLAVVLLLVALVGFVGAIGIGYNFSEMWSGVGAGLLIAAVAGFFAYDLWWRNTE